MPVNVVSAETRGLRCIPNDSTDSFAGAAWHALSPQSHSTRMCAMPGLHRLLLAFLFIDETRALDPLDMPVAVEGEVPETFATGM